MRYVPDPVWMADRICLRFRKGDWTNLEDVGIMAASWSRYVHVEVLTLGTAFSAYQGVSPCFMARQAAPDSNKWLTVPVPLTDVELGVYFLKQMIHAPLEYRTGWHCALPSALARALTTDVDCERPESWKHVFCSQAVLLWLRRCELHGILRVDRDKVDLEDLWAIHSEACSPGHLRALARDVFCHNQVADVLKRKGDERS